MSGARLLDAGCGTGALSIEAARRGARVVAVDLSPTLVSVARERLPSNMSGARLLDAGCGTGALSIEAARRGARVVAVDLSPTLVSVARERIPVDLDASALEFRSGDMLDPKLGQFDFVVAMDSLIHYRPADTCRIMAGLAARTSVALLVTFAPRTPALAMMHAVGRLFPRGDRAPAIEPVGEQKLRRLLLSEKNLDRWQLGRSRRITSGFYKSHALELIPR
jgi:magnesium-protoporphyrin O-methyltransferase